MGEITVDPSQVHSIEVDPSEVSVPGSGPSAGDVWRGAAGLVTSFADQSRGELGKAAKGAWDATKGFVGMLTPRFTTPQEHQQITQRALDLIHQGKYLDAAKHLASNAVEETPGGKALMGVIGGAADEYEKAKTAFQQRRYTEATGHGLAAALPGVGPFAAHLAETAVGQNAQLDKYGNEIQPATPPNPSGAIGEAAAGVLLPKATAKVVRAIPSEMPKPSFPGIPSSLNPVEQGAVDYLRTNDVPLTPGTITGNRFLRSAEAVTQASPLGAPTAADFNRGTQTGLQRVAGELSQKIAPRPTSPEIAGRAAGGALAAKVEDLGQAEDAAYGDAWKARNDPAHTYSVPVRTKPQLLLDSEGKPTGQTKQVEVRQPVNMPVDVRDIKAALKPVYEEMQWMPASDRASSAGYQAVKKILEGDDFIPAWQAERGLGGLKTMARTENKTGLRNASQGIAASIIPDLQESIDATVSNTGEGAVRGLQQGRALHANKMEIADLAEKLREEPVQTFQQLTWQKDAGIGFLRKVANQAPDVMPQIGRAYVDQLFDQATREGGFDKARTILSQWQNLGPETKRLLFSDPAVRSSLDRFFKGAELIGRNANPSGTEIVRSATSLNPLRIAAGYVGSKLLFSPKWIGRLTEAVKNPGPETDAGLRSSLPEPPPQTPAPGGTPQSTPQGSGTAAAPPVEAPGIPYEQWRDANFSQPLKGGPWVDTFNGGRYLESQLKVLYDKLKHSAPKGAREPGALYDPDTGERTATPPRPAAPVPQSEPARIAASPTEETVAFRSSSTPETELKLNDQGMLYTTPDREYSRNWGSHTQRLTITPKNTLDLTDFAGGDENITAQQMKEFLEGNGVKVSDELMRKFRRTGEGAEILQYFGQYGRSLLADALKAAGYDSAKINEYYEGQGRSTSTILFDAQLARRSESSQ